MGMCDHPRMVTRQLRSADAGLIAPAVVESLAALTLEAADQAAARLCRLYANEIDGAAPEDRSAVLEKLGPKLAVLLADLGATPGGRSRMRAGGVTRAEGRLAAIRAARR